MSDIITGYDNEDISYAPYENIENAHENIQENTINKEINQIINECDNVLTVPDNLHHPCDIIKPFREDDNKKISDFFHFEKNSNMTCLQEPACISTEDRELLIKYQPIIYTDMEDKYKFVNPNYYLEFTHIMFSDNIVGHKQQLNDKIYLCYNIFYETKRKIGVTTSNLSNKQFNYYIGDLFKIISIIIELDINNKVEYIYISPDIQNEKNYQKIGTLNENQLSFYLSNTTHNIYIINESIDRYKKFISYKNDYCNETNKIDFKFEPLYQFKIHNTMNEKLINFSIQTFINTPYSHNLFWIKPKLKIIPLWLYRILPKCISKFLYEIIL